MSKVYIPTLITKDEKVYPWNFFRKKLEQDNIKKKNIIKSINLLSKNFMEKWID